MISAKFMLLIDDDPSEFLNGIINMEWLEYLKSYCYCREDVHLTEHNMNDHNYKVIEYRFHLTDCHETLYYLKYNSY